uniref:Ribosomal L1 domain-containing protein 1-like n=1 Tax=Saccoglossus kowalevskii TaxID=10224 RepID=A0ABM0GX74_SACKO|nr:PREDICTED: ribosomal L1 domain-containing protein 1-like [Saccoglossus kowalevskii]
MASTGHVDGSVDLSLKRESQLDEEKVRSAVKALFAHYKHKQLKKKDLIEETETLRIQVTLWKVPVQKSKRFQICLPHSILSETAEVCLITKDEKNMGREECQEFYEKWLADKNVTTVSRVMPLRVLKKEYRPFELRRKLVAQYDLFLADDRIFRLLDTVTGKEFNKKKKYPVGINLKKNNLAKEINSAINATYFVLIGRGNCSGFSVANTSMTVEEAVENIMAAVQDLTRKIPRGWPNIRCLYLKTKRSVSIPLYTSIEYEQQVKESKTEKVEQEGDGNESGFVEEEETDTKTPVTKKKKETTNTDKITKKKRKSLGSLLTSSKKKKTIKT